MQRSPFTKLEPVVCKMLQQLHGVWFLLYDSRDISEVKGIHSSLHYNSNASELSQVVISCMFLRDED